MVGGRHAVARQGFPGCCAVRSTGTVDSTSSVNRWRWRRPQRRTSPVDQQDRLRKRNRSFRFSGRPGTKGSDLQSPGPPGESGLRRPIARGLVSCGSEAERVKGGMAVALRISDMSVRLLPEADEMKADMDIKSIGSCLSPPKGLPAARRGKRKIHGCSTRSCQICGKDPHPNYFYCTACHHRISASGEEDLGICNGPK